ncbi:Exosome non-catalytic core component [Rhodotorula mucilaginosa]|uniref:Exosome non-catalytic core component n=1 Tax=Rhodotorula mucilaginosa TaxID=5537 RepID=A0A9P6WA18_RHOMI|nr:Exosome non-catalytic core component [Rhodotorula mucilaginosa]
MQSRTQLLTPSALRLDSRLPLELRSLSFQILPSPPSTSSSSIGGGPPAHADGYALASHGLTTVASSVFGPREAQRTGPWSGGAGQSAGTGGGGATAGGAQKGDKAQVNVEVGIAAWAERVGQGAATEGGVRRAGKDRRTIEIAAAVKNTFEPVLLLHLYPRSSIDIYLQILENDGSLLQACINATSLALISAGLPLSDYVCSLTLASYPSLPPSGPPQIPSFELVSPPVAHTNSSDPTAMTNSGSTTLLDLVQAEEQALPALTVGVLPRSGKVTLVNLETRVGVGRFEEMLRWGVEGAKVVQGAMEEAVRDWADGLARPQKELGNLFPGLAGASGAGGRGGGRDDDDDEMDL